MMFRFATYNVHKGIGGLDRCYRPERIVETLRTHGPDVVFLQEVDDNVPRSHFHRQVDLFADQLQLGFSAYQKNVAVKQGYYGNAILSRFPLSNVDDLDLTIRFKKRRQALVANCTIECDGQSQQLVLVNFHLGLAGFERRIQVQQVLQSDAIDWFDASRPIIVAGDCNDYLGILDKRVMAPAGFLSVGRGHRTFPAFFPVTTLDYIYYRGGVSLDRAFACRSKVARTASDHLPLIADFRLTQNQSG